MKSDKRRTIGVFIDWIESSYHIELISTLEETAQHLGINLLIMVGGAIHSSQRFEVLCNAIYDFVNKKNVDGILLASGSLGHFCSSEDLVQFAKNYHPIPVVSVSQHLPGIVSIISDNTSGLKKLVQHLVKDHQYTTIGFIKGIEGNQDAEQRFDIYKKTLADCGIPFDKNYIAPGDFTSPSGREAIRLFFDKRKIKLDAIVAANDEMAIGAIEELKQRGFHIPLDIAVTGFDDQPSGAAMKPSLTTVRQNLGKQGIKALEELLEIINKKPTETKIVIPTEPVIRQSCGCSENTLLSLDTLLPEKKNQIYNNNDGNIHDDNINLIENKDTIFTRILEEVNQTIKNLNIKKNDLEKLLIFFLSDIESGREKSFLINLSKLLFKSVIDRTSSVYWIHIISSMIKTVASFVMKKESLLFIENIFFKAQFLIRTQLEMLNSTNKSEINDQIKLFSGLTEGIIGTVDIKSLMKLLSKAAPHMDISRCYFSIFSGDDLSQLKLLLAYDPAMENATSLIGIEFPTNEFIPDKQILKKRPYNLRVHPFLRDGVFLGLTVFEFSPSSDMLKHLLRKMFISSILKGVYIYETMKTESTRLEALVNKRTTDLKEAELRLIEANKALKMEKQIAVNANKIKSEFLANMSHEIRTPMSSILGFTEILKMNEANIEKKYRLNIIQRSGKHLLDLINDILDFSKIEADKIEFFSLPFSIKNMLSNIKNMFMLEAKKKDLLFTVTVDRSVPELVVGDERRLQQVIVNLVGNAFKFTPKGSVNINCLYENNNAIINISDTGIGIAEDKHELIFSAFSQADQSTARVYGGTGLGLTIAKNLTEKMGGSITLQSKIGEGSCFTINIPLFEMKNKKISTETEGDQDHTEDFADLLDTIGDLSGFRILVAEDTPDNQLLFGELLELLNVSFDIAPDGMQALNRLKEQHYDLLLLDMQMPVMDGMETISKIRTDSRLNDLPVIALTAHSLKGDKEKYLQAGCDEYLSKPIDIQLFFQKINRLLTDNNPKKVEKQVVNSDKPEKEKLDIRLKTGKREYFNQLLLQLKNNCNIFNPRDIHYIAQEINECLAGNDLKSVVDKIETAANTYDDDLLNWVILYLKKLK